MTPYGFIYLVRNRVNGKVYVGQTTDPVTRRWTEHKCDAKAGRGFYLHRAIRKYGPESFDVVTLHQAFSSEELNDMERRAIWSHDATNREYGYNMTEGGEPGTRGYRHTEETKQRISASNKGKTLGRPTWNKGKKTGIAPPNKGKTASAEARQRMAEAQRRYFSNPDARRKTSEATRRYFAEHPEARAKSSAIRVGRTHSEETRNKMSEAQKRRYETDPAARRKGRTHSEETRRKMSEAHKKRFADPDARRKHSNSLKGHVVSAETRAKLGKANRGRQFSEDARRNMSEAAKRRWASSKEADVVVTDI